MADRPQTPGDVDFAARNGWDRAYETYDDFDLPTYVGLPTFMKLPWVTGPGRLRRREVDVAIVGAPFDDAVSHRPGARFGPRAIREAQYTSGSIHPLQLGNEPFEILKVVDAGDANIVPAWIDRAHALIYRKVHEVAATGAIPIVLGGDHSITWPSATAVAEVRKPGSIGIVHFDAHADTAADDWGVLAGHGTPMRRLIESGAVSGRNFVQVGLRGYWPPVDVFQWMQEQGMRWHLMREIEERGAEAVIDDAIAEALDGPDAVYISVDIDVIDPGIAPGTGTPEPGGMLPREVLRAVRRIASAVEVAGMDIVEVSPPYDHAEVTAMAGNRLALELISALAAKKQAGHPVRFTGAALVVSEAEAAGDALARLYDLDLAEDPGDLDLYLALAGRTGGPVLELAVGTGRIAVPLAASGVDVTGVDTDPAMLARARRAAGAAGLGVARRLRLVEGDARTVRLDDAGAYRLAVIPLNSLFLMGTRRQQADAVATLAAHLAPGGLAVVDAWLSDADDLSRYDGRLSLEWVRQEPDTGRTVTKTASAIYDPASSVVRLTTIFEASAPGEAAARGCAWTGCASSGRTTCGLRRGRGPRRRGARGRLRPRSAGGGRGARRAGREAPLTTRLGWVAGVRPSPGRSAAMGPSGPGKGPCRAW